jgi:predicted transcriptional regulator
MKRILVEIDDKCARDLERVAPAKQRTRAEFIRRAIQRAIDVALDRATEAAYRELPVAAGITAADLVGWDDHNELVRQARRKPRPKRAA